MDFARIDYLAVLLATLATMILGFVWYSPVLFGNFWVKQVGKNMEDMSGSSPLTYVWTALTALVGVFILALLLTMTSEVSVSTGLTAGLLVGIGISAKIGMNFLFEDRKLGLFLITIGYHLVSYVIAGLILGSMQG